MEFRLKPVNGAKTTMRLTVFVDGDAVWPVASAPDIAMDIPIDDLLSHLVEFWAPLALRQTYPLPVATSRPLDLRAAAERRWDEQPAEVAASEDAALGAFEEAHDLSRCFSGYFDLPPLWLLRRGERMIVDTRAGFNSVDFVIALHEFTRLGDAIAGRLAHAGNRWSRLIELWRRREIAEPLALLAWSTGLPPAVAERLTQSGALTAPANFAAAANDNDELRIAARMAGALPPEQIGAVLALVSRFAKREAAGLDELARDVSDFIAGRHGNRRPHEQGELAARRVRDKFGLDSLELCDIASSLEKLGVAVEFGCVQPRSLRALAIDGLRHGPVAFVNLSAAASRDEAQPSLNTSVRVNLAHEFCHLLLDRSHALAAVEVLNSRMPVEIEQRAKSFAGELLAPTEAVASLWKEAGSPRSLSALKSLTSDVQRHFGVTRAVAAWKLQHATQSVDVDVSRLLDQIAPGR